MKYVIAFSLMLVAACQSTVTTPIVHSNHDTGMVRKVTPKINLPAPPVNECNSELCM